MVYLWTVLSALIGYLLGCIPVGVFIARIYGNLDIRKTGSGNSGTTNVLRTLGWFPSVITLVGDCLKGVLGAWIGKLLGGEAGMLLGGFFAVLGHDFPVFMGFKGGKGIATSLGITFVICTPVAPWLVVIVLAIVAVTRMMSLGSLVASLSYPALFWIYLPEGANRLMFMSFAVAAMLLSIFCHRSNIARLVHRRENKLNFGRITHISKEYMRKHREKRAKK